MDNHFSGFRESIFAVVSGVSTFIFQSTILVQMHIIKKLFHYHQIVVRLLFWSKVHVHPVHKIYCDLSTYTFCWIISYIFPFFLCWWTILCISLSICLFSQYQLCPVHISGTAQRSAARWTLGDFTQTRLLASIHKCLLNINIVLCSTGQHWDYNYFTWSNSSNNELANHI